MIGLSRPLRLGTFIANILDADLLIDIYSGRCFASHRCDPHIRPERNTQTIDANRYNRQNN